MLTEAIVNHLQRVATMYPLVEPGSNLTDPSVRNPHETVLLNEIGTARKKIQDLTAELGRTTAIKVSVGAPKGAWAHIYYLSFHDSSNSSGPTEGFYPVFLMSADFKRCYLSVCLAAGSVGISGRGGWSKLRGSQLQTRSRALGSSLICDSDWVFGPVKLGEGGSYLHKRSGADRASGRGYECGAIISREFDPQVTTRNLGGWLREAFDKFDNILKEEIQYIRTMVPVFHEKEQQQQISAIITGKKAEDLFSSWVTKAHPEWGIQRDLTGFVGFGYDFEFPDSGLKLEIKGCRGEIEDVRLTENEWKAAKSFGDAYVLCIVNNVNTPEKAVFTLIVNPFTALKSSAISQSRLQITYTLPRKALELHASTDL